jgi:predicted RNase H-like HicB family nuclease
VGIEYFVGVLERADSGYNVFFPDVPGCTSAARTRREAWAQAGQALNDHLSLLRESGEEMPQPSEQLQLGEGYLDVCSFIVPVPSDC